MARAADPPSRRQSSPRYHRGRFTWLAFSGLLAVGFFQATLGPALPYIRTAEHISYLPAALLQGAFAIGGGTAGLLSAARIPSGRRALIIGVGVAGMAAAGAALGYVNVFGWSLAAAFFMSLFGTSAIIRFWAALADQHQQSRTVAMTEGEVCVSIGGIIAPFAFSLAAATVLGWRSAFLLGVLVAAATIAALTRIPVPSETDNQDPPDNQDTPDNQAQYDGPSVGHLSGDDRPPDAEQPASKRRLTSTLVVVFAVVAAEWSMSFWLASYLNDDVHLSRGLSVTLISVLYAAEIAGRLAASRLARRMTAGRLLAIALALALCGSVLLVTATGLAVAVVAIAVAGTGIGASFPLASSLHVGARAAGSTVAVGEVMTTASVGQLTGPLLIGAISQASNLRVGLVVLPVLTLLGAAALAVHRRSTHR
jgi:MFS family permease